MTTIITELCNASKEHHTDIHEPARENEDTLVLSSDTPQQLYRMIPMVSPLFRKTLAHIINHPDVIETEITPNERITLLYLYTSISVAMIHPSKQTFEERVESFHEEPPWKLTSHLSAESMALWGFFRKTPKDKQHTCCFACGCVLSDWGMYDNPFLGHSQSRPQCPGILMIAFINRIGFNMNQHDFSLPNSRENHALPMDVMKHRLKQFSNLYKVVNLPTNLLAKIGAQSVVICRDIFNYSTCDIVFALWRKMFCEFNTQKTGATLGAQQNIEVHHLYDSAQALVNDILLNGKCPFTEVAYFIRCIDNFLQQPSLDPNAMPPISVVAEVCVNEVLECGMDNGNAQEPRREEHL